MTREEALKIQNDYLQAINYSKYLEELLREAHAKEQKLKIIFEKSFEEEIN